MKPGKQFLLLAALLLVQLDVQAGPRHAVYEWLASNDYGVSLDSAVSQARKRFRGRVLSAETGDFDGRRAHKIKILTEQGRVKRLRIDPGTGEYLRPSRRHH